MRTYLCRRVHVSRHVDTRLIGVFAAGKFDALASATKKNGAEDTHTKTVKSSREMYSNIIVVSDTRN